MNFLSLHYQGCLCCLEDALWTFEHFCVGSTVVQRSCERCTFIGCESVGAAIPFAMSHLAHTLASHQMRSTLVGTPCGLCMLRLSTPHSPLSLADRRDHFNPTLVISDVSAMRKGVQATHA